MPDDSMPDDIMQDDSMQDGHVLTIAEHSKLCSYLFSRYVLLAWVDPWRASICRDELSFGDWEWGSFVHRTTDISLDNKLMFNPAAVKKIHEHLDVIGNALIQCKYLQHQVQMRRSSRILY